MSDLWIAQYSWQNFMDMSGSVNLIQSRPRSELQQQAEVGGSVLYAGLQRGDHRAVGQLSAIAPDKLVLEDINVEVAKNATVAFVGESGSGKSTLVDLIMGTLKPSRGTIAIDGQSLAGHRPRDRAPADRLCARKTPCCSTIPSPTTSSLWTASERDARFAKRPRRAKVPSVHRRHARQAGLAGRSEIAASCCPAGRSSGWPSPASC